LSLMSHSGQMRARDLRWALLAPLLLGLVCACSRVEAPDVDVEGALVLSCTRDTLTLRAFAPEVKVDVRASSGRIARGYAAEIHNVASGTECRLVLPGGETSKGVKLTRPNSTTVLARVEEELPRWRLTCQPGPELTSGPPEFAVVGDSQGRNDVLALIVERINQREVEFVVHLGDMVPSGNEDEYRAFLDTMAELDCPYFTVPGNHDTRNDGYDLYTRTLAPAYHGFRLGGYRFLFLDSSRMGLDDQQWAWLEEALCVDEPTVIFMHVPAVDPRGKDHGFLNQDDARDFMNLVERHSDSVRAVFSGHVHVFDQADVSGVTFLTSGGGGASLYAHPDEGGYHHYVLVRLDDAGVDTEVEKIKPPGPILDLVVSGKEKDAVIPPEQLMVMATKAAKVAFQNRLGNYRGEGVYRGVPVSSLVEMVGGIEEGEALRVCATDGYCQLYDRCNVWPDECGWYERQGEMVLAVEYEGTTLPEWDDGYRVAFLAPDGVFDNQDCEATSAPGQGCDVYDSAGARCVRNVVRLEVVTCGEE